MNGSRAISVNVRSEWDVLLQERGKNDAIGCLRAIVRMVSIIEASENGLKRTNIDGGSFAGRLVVCTQHGPDPNLC